MRHFILRVFDMLAGLLIFALGIVMTIRANIGYSPWDVFHAGLAGKIGLSLGVSSILVGFVILIIVSLFKEKLGFGTICNIVFIGLFIDLIILLDFIPLAANLVFGTIMLVTGLFIIAIGSCFYIRSGFGAGPRDNLMVVMTRKTRLPVGLCRGIIEFLVTIIGWILGGMVGFGTILSVIAISFCIQIVFKLFKFDVTLVKHETLKETFAAIKKLY